MPLTVVLKMTLSTVSYVLLYAAMGVTGSDPPLPASVIDFFVTLFCAIVLTCDFLLPEGCSDGCLNHQCECSNWQQMRCNLNSSGGTGHYTLKEVTVVSNLSITPKIPKQAVKEKGCYIIFSPGCF